MIVVIRRDGDMRVQIWVKHKLLSDFLFNKSTWLKAAILLSSKVERERMSDFLSTRI
jgi:hypothetical protein